jgi:hypothetical protein
VRALVTSVALRRASIHPAAVHLDKAGLPRMWHNPWAPHPTNEDLPFAASRVCKDETSITNDPPTVSPSYRDPTSTPALRGLDRTAGTADLVGGRLEPARRATGEVHGRSLPGEGRGHGPPDRAAPSVDQCVPALEQHRALLPPRV